MKSGSGSNLDKADEILDDILFVCSTLKAYFLLELEPVSVQEPVKNGSLPFFPEIFYTVVHGT